ncbi:alpha-amylase family protein [Devosia neptuniae]|uniref:Alpha-amylase family protein n=1 Tax=Devosia neptuniae TaxID=191302 RepID=A0ABY6CIF6_9HYPH|nr:alpha-amylase family protein [Devosia neptuniae]UXN72016.1 alpha-amylase family protein [Devosia neptuniae]
MAHEEPWYLDAVFYAIDVKRFADADGDGIGDFPGLTSKIPYLSDLGVTCIWLLPFFASPGRDNGYDVSDYYRIDPRLGTTQDFLDFLHAAGERGIRVIIDLVVNHTSDEHPWFEAARRDERSRFRDYYVWSGEAPPVKPDDQSVFPDDEPTIWTYDQVAHAFYYHKFYRFQPDLNTGNPAVLDAIEHVMDYWLSLGVAGFRLDAIPFVIGQNGLSSADPDNPDGVLQRFNTYIQDRRPGGLLVGEVNLPPAETGRYFGQGDQLGLLFNFLLPCYVFAGLATEQAGRISEALDLLPEPPPDCGWANFLRNLDELDFSQVPSDVRAEAFAAFAKDPKAVVHDRGIRRRIAPMLDGNRQRIAMALSLTMSLPGASVLVYGDEIGMGDDLSQPDRVSVRSPMQWTAGKNGGFSKAAPSKLIQPAIDEGRFAYPHVNVAQQADDPASLLGQVKALIRAKRGVSKLLRGRALPVSNDNPAVHVRAVGDGANLVLLAHNLSGQKQDIALGFGEHFSAQLSDLLGRDTFDVNDTLALSLPPYGYRWLQGAKRNWPA